MCLDILVGDSCGRHFRPQVGLVYKQKNLRINVVNILFAQFVRLNFETRTVFEVNYILKKIFYLT